MLYKELKTVPFGTQYSLDSSFYLVSVYSQCCSGNPRCHTVVTHKSSRTRHYTSVFQKKFFFILQD